MHSKPGYDFKQDVLQSRRNYLLQTPVGPLAAAAYGLEFEVQGLKPAYSLVPVEPSVYIHGR